MIIFLDKLVKPKCVSCPNISYGKNCFSKNLENSYKSKEILYARSGAWTHTFLITSPECYPLHYRTKLKKLVSYVWHYQKVQKIWKSDFCHIKCWDMKHILVLPTCHEIWSCEELKQIDFGKFDLGHLVHTHLSLYSKYNTEMITYHWVSFA